MVPHLAFAYFCKGGAEPAHAEKMLPTEPTPVYDLDLKSTEGLACACRVESSGQRLGPESLGPCLLPFVTQS